MQDYTTWSQFISVFPVPIFADVVPYYYDIPNIYTQAAMRQALVDYISGTTIADETIVVANTSSYAGYWDTYGQRGNCPSIICVKPNPPSGFSPVGDSSTHFAFVVTVKTNSTTTAGVSVATKYSSPLLLPAANTYRIWTDRGSGANADGAFYGITCPANYQPMGYITQLNYNSAPGYGNYMCVHSRCAVHCQAYQFWADWCASDPASKWSTYSSKDGLSPNTAFAFWGYYPSVNPPVLPCIRKNCLKSYVVNASAMQNYVATAPPQILPSGSYVPTTGVITSSPLTTSPLTTSQLTTRQMTTSLLSTSPLTSSPLTTSPLTTQQLTTSDITTTPLTTQDLTTSELTTSFSPIEVASNENINSTQHSRQTAIIASVAVIIIVAIAVVVIICLVKRHKTTGKQLKEANSTDRLELSEIPNNKC